MRRRFERQELEELYTLPKEFRAISRNGVYIEIDGVLDFFPKTQLQRALRAVEDLEND